MRDHYGPAHKKTIIVRLQGRLLGAVIIVKKAVGVQRAITQTFPKRPVEIVGSLPGHHIDSRTRSKGSLWGCLM